LKAFGERFPVADVPIELELCEFGCRETRCNGERWETCEQRLRHAEKRRAQQPEPTTTD
jgi:hypothetical protein